MRYTIILLVGTLLLSSCSRDKKGGDPFVPVITTAPSVQLSEIVTHNHDLKDQFDKDPGWVELHNPSDTAVSLNGFGLSASLSEPGQWTFGDMELAPGGYLVVFLSGRDIPVAIPASDSVNLISSYAWGWADNQNTPSGNSSVAPYAFNDYIGEQDGVPAISAQITLAENSGTDLTWSSASVFLEFGTGDAGEKPDLSSADQLVLRGYVDAGKKLEIRLAQPDLDDWKGWATTLTGTGNANEEYLIALPQNTDYPDLPRIYGMRFASAENQYQTIRFTFSSIHARKQPHAAHASIKLSSDGGTLYLSNPAGAAEDSVRYPAIPAALSYARDDSGQPWSLRTPPTPGAANALLSYAGLTPAPQEIPASGVYDSPFTFTLPVAADSGSLRCDTTGAAPSYASTIQGGTLELTRTTVLRCARFRDGYAPSDIIMRTYLIGERTPSLPVISIATQPGSLFDPDTGLYEMGPNPGAAIPYWGANYWWDKELPIQLEFFEPSARSVWTAHAGLKMFGNYSRSNPKKSVSLTFREKYGQSRLEYPVFPEFPEVRQFKALVLRNNGNNTGTDYIRDALASSLTEGLGIDYQKNRSVIVYYNGMYYGIHQLRERSTEYYFESNYGYDPASIDLIKAGGEVSSGSGTDYQNIMQWLENHSLQPETNYQWLRNHLDIDNYINYVQTEIYIANKDWPGNNLKIWRENVRPTLWKWFIYDTDFGFNTANLDADTSMLAFLSESDGPGWPNPPHSTLLFRSLLENRNFRHAFINRYSLLLRTWYSPQTVQNRIDALMNPLQSEIPLDQRRWGFSSYYMANQLAEISRFGKLRADKLEQELKDFFGLEQIGQWTLKTQGSGTIQIHGQNMPAATITLPAYADTPLQLKAVPEPGATFLQWSDGIKSSERTETPSENTGLTAQFR